MSMSFVVAVTPAVELLRASVAGLPISIWLVAVPFAGLLVAWLTVRYIPNNKVGVVEKLWSAQGSVPEGCIIALNGEADPKIATLPFSISVKSGQTYWQCLPADQSCFY